MAAWCSSAPARASLADRKDPLNQVAALVPNPFDRRPLKLIVLLDASGSMGETIAEGPASGQVKFGVVSDAVLSLREHLTPHDELAVVTFSDFPRRIYDSGAAGVDFAVLGAALAKVRPSGPTYILPALDEAIASADLRGRQGLVLVLSDLRTEKIDDVAALALRLSKAGLGLAVAASPDATDEGGPFPLELLAAQMKAPVVHSKSFIELAEVFARLLRRARPDALRSGLFTARSLANYWLPTGSLPAVNAYLLCAPAENSDVLAAVSTQSAWPFGAEDALLARRVVGLGRSVSLAMPLSAGANPAWEGQATLGHLLGGAVDSGRRARRRQSFGGRTSVRQRSVGPPRAGPRLKRAHEFPGFDSRNAATG